MKFITLRKEDPRLREYLLGTFSQSERALPLEFYSPTKDRPSVTLRLEPTAACRKGVSVGRVLLSLSRWHLLGFTVGALILFSVLQPEFQQVIRHQWSLVGLIWISVLSLHVGANGFNDYVDHLRRVDVLQHRSGSRVIQRGWLAAWQVRNLSLAATSLGALCGIVVLWIAQGRAIGFAVLAGLGVLTYSQMRRSLKSIGLAEISLFLLCGPALILGYQQILFDHWDWQGFLFGCWSGLAAAQFIFLRNWQNLQTDDLLGIQTLAVKLGFDRCRNLLMVLSVLRFFVFVGYSVMHLRSTVLALAAIEAVLLYRLFTGSRHIRSVFSSEIVHLRRLIVDHAVGYTVAALLYGILTRGTGLLHL